MNTSYQIGECEGLQETIASLKQQLTDIQEARNLSPLQSCSLRFSELKGRNSQQQVEKGSEPSKSGDLHLQAQVCC